MKTTSKRRQPQNEDDFKKIKEDKDELLSYQTKTTNPFPSNQAYPTIPTKPNLPNQAQPTEPNLLKITYQTKPTIPNLTNLLPIC